MQDLQTPPPSTAPVSPLTTWEDASTSNPNLTKERWEKSEEISKKSRYWSRLTFESICAFDMTALGPKVKAPSLILHGDGERIRFSEKEAEKGDCGHNPQRNRGVSGACP